MGRIVLLLIIGFLIWLAFRGFFRVQTRKRADIPAKSTRGEDMVACSRCGVNLPRSEALESGGRFFCSEEHRQLGNG